jgi:2-polyprenyl-3-methyl-5-hydroxy-6-metoxy-1,4-benzoquinol methylase
MSEDPTGYPSRSDRFNTVDCDLCGSTIHDLVFEKEGFRHVRCRNCGMVFVNPRLAEHGEMQKSEGTGTMGDDRLSSAQIRRLRRELASLEPFRKHNRLLEIGAGRGWFLEQASLRGWETWALEINESALKHLRSRGVGRILTQPAEDLQAEEAGVDVVRMWDVIEHLQSPRKAVEAIVRALRPGGLLRLSTTNFASLSRWINGPEWVYLNGSDHIFLFEPATITRLLSEHGFEQIQIRTRSFNLRRKLYHPERDLPVRYPLLSPFRKLIDETIRLTPYGHQMIVTATKAVT